ncbi:MAG: hypothetical protein ACI8QS_002999, partial [Planctomycetota bacterium]
RPRYARLLLRLLAPLLILMFWGTVTFAQAPKVGREVYTDQVDLGFSIKQPKDWDLVPPRPNEVNLIAKFTPRLNKYVNYGGGALFLDVLLVRFDKRLDGDDDMELDAQIERILNSGVSNAAEFVDKRMGGSYGGGYRFDEDEFPKPLKGIKGTEARYTLFEGSMDPKDVDSAPTMIYVAEFDLNERTTIAMIGVGPGGKKWRTYEKTFVKLAKSFQRVEVVDLFEEARNAPDADTLRGKKRIELLMEAAKSGDWTLHETENYFVISAIDDKEFLEELMSRLEAIRDVYEVDYPEEKARARSQAPNSGQERTEEEIADDERRANAAELSRTSVVRVCRSSGDYREYGGPPGSAGYWSSRDEELVVFDDKAVGGRADTWITLNHEAFHQYIFYFYGSIAPHSWYNEGTGDYYSGYQLKNGRFNLKENPWRKSTIKEMIRTGEYVPLQDIVRWTQGQYYGTNDLDIGGGQCYAQGWSFIYFLRTGEGKARGWQDSWGGILDKYLSTLAISGDLDEAVDTAFEGVDWEALETAWKDYIG